MLSVIAVANTIGSLTEAKRLLEKAVGLDATLAETRVLLGAVRVCKRDRLVLDAYIYHLIYSWRAKTEA